MMEYCSICGSRNDDRSSFCVNCGSHIDHSPTKLEHQTSQNNIHHGYHQQFQQGYNHGYTGYEGYFMGGSYRTPWLSFVIILNWIYVVVFGVIGLTFIFIGNIANASGVFTIADVLQEIGFLLLVLTFSYAYVNYQLSKFNNSARIIIIVFHIFLLFISLAITSSTSFILSILGICALVFHEETKQLFIQTRYY